MSPRAPLLLALLLSSGCREGAPWPASPAEDARPRGEEKEKAPEVPLLREEARTGLEAQLGVGSLSDLPLYAIDQVLDDASGALEGRLTLTYTNLTGAALQSLPLLLHPNAAKELGSTGGAGLTISSIEDESGAAVHYEMTRPTLCTVTLPAPLDVGAKLTLRIRYQGHLRALAANANDLFSQSMHAMGSLTNPGETDYGLMAQGDGIVTLASAYPMVAPFREGAFDTSAPARVGDLAYNNVARFSVRTAVPEGVSLVTNLVDADPAPGPSATTVVTSQGALVRDFVLVAGRDLTRESVTVDGTRVTSVYRARDAAAGHAVLESARLALASYTKRFGPYPFTELDLAEASLVGGAGGVEFMGMDLIAGMLYRDPADSESPLALLFKLWGQLGAQLGGMGEEVASPRLGGMLDTQLEFTVAHEVAHQYFAGLVGNDSRRYPVLDEPLARYAASLAIEDRHGAATASSSMDLNIKLNYAIYRLLGGVDRSAERDTAHFATPLEYAALVYGKAPYLYVALRRSLGEAKLSAAIKAAVTARRFRLTSISEWVDALEAGAGGPASGVREAAAHWLTEAHGDADLGVDDSGDFVLDSLFPPEVGESLRETLPALGMRPSDLLKMLFGGGLGDAPPTGPGIDPASVLRSLEGE